MQGLKWVLAASLTAGLGAVFARDALLADEAQPADEMSDGPLDADDEAAMTEEVGPTQPEPQASLLEVFFSDLSSSNVQQKADAIFATNVVYDDPSGHYEGREAAVQHLQGLLTGMNTLAIDVREEFVSGDETVAIWTATLTHKSLSSGEPIIVDGVTHAKIKDGKVVSQRDYYDLGGAVYEHVPVIGMLVAWVKGKLH